MHNIAACLSKYPSRDSTSWAILPCSDYFLFSNFQQCFSLSSIYKWLTKFRPYYWILATWWSFCKNGQPHLYRLHCSSQLWFFAWKGISSSIKSHQVCVLNPTTSWLCSASLKWECHWICCMQLIVWAPTRERAIERMKRALTDTIITDTSGKSRDPQPWRKKTAILFLSRVLQTLKSSCFENVYIYRKCHQKSASYSNQCIYSI